MTDYREIVDTYQDNMTRNAVTANRSSGILLRYPLNKDDVYGGTITFRARKVNYGDLTDSYKKLILEDENFKKITNADPNTNTGNSNSAFNQSASDQANRRAIELQKYIDQSSPNGTRKCTLYLPNAIQFRDGATYDGDFELGTLGASIRAGAMSNNTASEMAAAVGQSIIDTGRTIANAAMGRDVNGEDLQIALQRVTPGRVAGALSSVSGITLNPNKRALFKGVEVRNFTFTFAMIPSSPNEAIAIENIVKFFREEMYPETINQLGVDTAFKFPSIFDIVLRYRKSDGNYVKVATKILPSFLRSVDVTYNQNGMSFHRDGKPQQTNITLNFVEERTLDKYDVAIRGY